MDVQTVSVVIAAISVIIGVINTRAREPRVPVSFVVKRLLGLGHQRSIRFNARASSHHAVLKYHCQQTITILGLT